MEIDTIYYKAKDGRLFTDPIECEEYEKTIGIISGSIGDLIRELEKKDPSQYLFGVLLVKCGGITSIYTRCTVCCDDQLESFVNVKNLMEEQRYISYTIGMMLEQLRELDKDAPCQYLFVYSPNRNFSNNLGAMANQNSEIWK